jgi:uncharacterized membrane protein
MNTILRLLGIAGLSAAVTYLWDPGHGRRRRALLRDRIVSAGRDAGDALQTTSRDLANRTQGMLARIQRWRGGPAPSDRVIAERIRSQLGVLVRHPRSIDVAVSDGRVTLTGPILRDEVDRLVARVGRMAGVKTVENRLQVHESAGTVPGLQGDSPRPRPAATLPFLRRVWSPTTRLVAGVGGTALALWGSRRGGAAGTAVGLGGLALLARGITNLEFKRLLGIGAGRRAIHVRKTIEVMAPIEAVFDLWSHFENFPRFMSHVREVRRQDERRSHWVVAGPAGVPIEWDTELTVLVPHEFLAWRTVPGSAIQHAGTVRFEPSSLGTRVHVEMSYTPPGGALSHAVAALFGADPKRAMDDDLVRFKSLMEDGKATARGQTVRGDELAG